MKKYDLLVIGSGAGNIVLDAGLDAGLSCALVEEAKFGGTCLNRGCIPSKVFITPADLLHDLSALMDLGILEGSVKINFPKLIERVTEKTSENLDILAEYKAEPNLDVYQGKASFLEDKVVKVSLNDGTGSLELTADKIVIAAGSRTRVPDVPGLAEVGYLKSESFFADKLPTHIYDSLLIVGGGVIGCEFAHFFASYGCKVTIIQHNQNLLPKLDREITDALYRKFDQAGITYRLNQEVVAAGSTTDGLKELTILDRASGKEEKVHGTEILLAPGIVSNADHLQIAENSHIALDARAYIKTNEFLETSVEGIYALGDIVGHQQLRHKANYEAECLAHNLFSGKDRRRVRYDLVPAAIFTYPQIATVGMTEDQAKDQGIDYRVGKFYYGHTAKGYAMGIRTDEQDFFTKVIVDKQTGKILGAHIIGPEASILIQAYVSLLNTGHYQAPIYQPEIGSGQTQKERENRSFYLDPQSLAAVNETMTIHPALTEVAMWAAGEIDLGD